MQKLSGGHEQGQCSSHASSSQISVCHHWELPLQISLHFAMTIGLRHVSSSLITGVHIFLYI